MSLPQAPLFYQHLLDNLNDAIIGLDDDGKITFANTRAAEILDLDITNMENKPLHNLFQDLDSNSTPYSWSDSPIGYACRKRQPFQEESGYFKSGKNKIKVSYRCTPTPQLEDSATAIALIFRETQIKKATTEQTIPLHDPVTGLGGSALFQVMLKKAVGRAGRRQSRVGLLHVNLLGFTKINETYGAEAGDAILKETATRIEKCIRASDVAMRLEGDNFSIIAEDIDTTLGAIPLAERITTTLERVYMFEGQEIPVNSAIGIAVYPDHSWDSKNLISKAKEALKEAQNQAKPWHMATGDL